MSRMPASASARSWLSSAWTRNRRFKSSTLGPYSTSRYWSPSARQTTAGRLGGGGARPQNGVLALVGMRQRRQAARERGDRRIHSRLHAARLGQRHRAEADQIAGLELPDLPKLGIDDGGRAHEAAQAGTIGTQNHGHVASEIDGPDGVGVIVNIGRVQSGLAAIRARPLGLGADQPDARAVGIVVYLPGRGEEGFDVCRGEEIGRAVRAVENADIPGVRVSGDGDGTAR